MGGVKLGLFALVAAWIVPLLPVQAGTAAVTQGGARLEIDRDMIDFGKQPYGKMLQAVFRLRNVGDQILLLPSNLAIEVLEGC